MKTKISINAVLEHCTLYCIVLTINVGIGTYFVYSHWYLRNDDARVMLGTRTETTIY